MGQKILRILFVLLLLGGAPALVHAQDKGITKEESDRNQAKIEKDKKKTQAKEEKRRYKKHLENQDKDTRKRIKQHKRRSDKHGTGKQQDPFLRRLFGSKH